MIYRTYLFSFSCFIWNIFCHQRPAADIKKRERMHYHRNVFPLVLMGFFSFLSFSRFYYTDINIIHFPVFEITYRCPIIVASHISITISLCRHFFITLLNFLLKTHWSIVDFSFWKIYFLRFVLFYVWNIQNHFSE